ncbi:MAG: prepilin-type N-terminal cleavage/methylation domain-containing protein [Fimbriimonadaceae bacterium]|nr:prepilin-type N-terminal cleavage/methylation domain-containing protein [Fimbriimonadaceae bacterium]
MRSRQAGITLIETLLVAAMSAIILTGVSSSYVAAHNFQARIAPRQEQAAIQRTFEDRVTRLLETAFLTAEEDTTTFFVASIDGENPIEPSASGSTSLPDTLIFTSAGTTTSGAFLNTSATETFEDLNATYGPQGGVAEFGLSVLAVGDPAGRTGLFLREQRPSDGDAFQGGYESVMDEHVTSIGFEFFDGIQWVTEWDTTIATEKRLPAAVRVTYTLDSDDGSNHVFTVRLMFSDVTPENPAATSGGIGGGQ